MKKSIVSTLLVLAISALTAACDPDPAAPGRDSGGYKHTEQCVKSPGPGANALVLKEKCYTSVVRITVGDVEKKYGPPCRLSWKVGDGRFVTETIKSEGCAFTKSYDYQPGEKLNFEVTFKPDKPGSVRGRLYITDNIEVIFSEAVNGKIGIGTQFTTKY